MNKKTQDSKSSPANPFSLDLRRRSKIPSPTPANNNLSRYCNVSALKKRQSGMPSWKVDPMTLISSLYSRFILKRLLAKWLAHKTEPIIDKPTTQSLSKEIDCLQNEQRALSRSALFLAFTPFSLPAKKHLTTLRDTLNVRAVWWWLWEAVQTHQSLKLMRLPVSYFLICLWRPALLGEWFNLWEGSVQLNANVLRVGENRRVVFACCHPYVILEYRWVCLLNTTRKEYKIFGTSDMLMAQT